MKYTDVNGFQKHFTESAPSNFSPCYFISMPDFFERELFAARMQQFYVHHHVNTEVFRLRSTSNGAKDLLQHMEESSLFSSNKIILFSGVECFTGSDWKKIEGALAGCEGSVTLILSSEKGVSTEMRFLEKKGSILDLSKEKPWDKKRRIQDRLLEKIRKGGKRIDVRCMELLFEKVGVDGARLESEIDKLFCYVGEKSQIEEKDIHMMVSSSVEQKGWSIATALVWQEKLEVLDQVKLSDLSALIALFGAIRYHLYLALKICESQRTGRKLEVANIRPKQLDFYSKQCQTFGEEYFSNALIQLFEVEMKAKSTTLSSAALWDLLRISIHAAASCT